jgi:hypothetical protein
MQRLPAGRLAAHGYTTRWGFFEGTCNGAGELPFEVSKDYIETCIDLASNRATAFRALAAEAEANRNPAAVSVNVYLGQRVGGGISGYQWIKSRLESSPGFVQFWHPGDYRKPAGWRRLPIGSGFTLAEAVIHLAGKYADHLEKRAANFDRYVAWQSERIATWAPAPLTPIDPPVSRPR